ncbi:hypothetical protein [Melittangium boletus]|uniref:Uncharacterized protein n=1 Tax=Melittangium boletus DSM 14713 TaxID=1294270 RepID=A0A250IHB7_9BACT|nr:hypothetical protein [Melittangium boletus]ATB30623.1 hypothetical protein MEBOL_004084 [Melittangium boletus DSM 14713]
MMRTVPEIIRWGGKLVLVGAALLLAACRDPAKVSGTALYVTTQFDPTLLLTQVRVWGEVAGQPHFGPQVIPEQQERVLHSGETLRVLLGDVPNGVTAQVSVEGLRDNVVVARGESGVDIQDGYEVDVTVRLEPVGTPPTDGGTGGGDGTFCIGCEGCCIQGQCASSTFNTCGTGGISCVACDPARATGCDQRGVCVCGANPACAPETSDRCLLGMCRCGNSAACGKGQQCVNGSCVCTSDSCPGGCCSGNTCEPGTTKDRCGKGGESCAKCKKTCNADGTCD